MQRGKTSFLHARRMIRSPRVWPPCPFITCVEQPSESFRMLLPLKYNMQKEKYLKYVQCKIHGLILFFKFQVYILQIQIFAMMRLQIRLSRLFTFLSNGKWRLKFKYHEFKYTPFSPSGNLILNFKEFSNLSAKAK